jgi:hypothetical protein
MLEDSQLELQLNEDRFKWQGRKFMRKKGLCAEFVLGNMKIDVAVREYITRM